MLDIHSEMTTNLFGCRACARRAPPCGSASNLAPRSLSGSPGSTWLILWTRLGSEHWRAGAPCVERLESLDRRTLRCPDAAVLALIPVFEEAALLSARATREMIESAQAAARVEYEARRVKERPKEAVWKRRERARKCQAGQASASRDDDPVSRFHDRPKVSTLGFACRLPNNASMSSLV
jgi:hypothetical protein